LILRIENRIHVLKCTRPQITTQGVREILQELDVQATKSFSFHRILVAIDGSDNSKRAAQVAMGIAKNNNCELVVLYALNSPATVLTSTNQPYMPEIDYSSDYYNEALKVANDIVDYVVDQSKRFGVNVRGIVDRSVASTVEAIVNQGINVHADLIVVGTRGLGGFKRLVMGSVSSGVVQHADCSVLVVR
jgi:nucleotide-binding universal stress UspA family protein